MLSTSNYSYWPAQLRISVSIYRDPLKMILLRLGLEMLAFTITSTILSIFCLTNLMSFGYRKVSLWSILCCGDNLMASPENPQHGKWIYDILFISLLGTLLEEWVEVYSEHTIGQRLWRLGGEIDFFEQNQNYCPRSNSCMIRMWSIWRHGRGTYHH